MTTHAAMIVRMPWHDGGLFVGMRRLWWSVWILMFVFLIWGWVRLLGDRSATRDRVEREELAEEALRRPVADGEIDEEEYVHRRSVLRETHDAGDVPWTRPPPSAGPRVRRTTGGLRR